MLLVARQHNLLWTLMTASVDFGATLRLQGKLRQAEQVFRNALTAAHQAGVGNLGYMGRLEAFLANILYEQNQLDAAEQLVLASITHNRSWQNNNHSVYAYLVYWKIAQAKGESAKAKEALALAGEVAEPGFLIPNLRASLEIARVRSWLAAGHLAQALRWAHDQTNRTGKTYDEAQEQVKLTLARIHFAMGKKPEAYRLLTTLEGDIQSLGLANLLIEVLTLTTLCAPSQTDALAALGRALELGLPEGYARVFLDEGAPMLALLQSYRVTAGITPEIRIYLDGLLEQAGIRPSLETTTLQEQTVLTHRELEILKALASGMNNQQIGSELFISAGTVKAHTSAIYRKLNVVNRMEAIARAKDLGLI
jgi:LuxR family transcriptional regulator, maltose regulon positive regulatory protein